MSGVEPIIDKILLDANELFETMVNEANAKSEEIIKESRITANAKKIEILEAATVRCDTMQNASKSASLINGRNTILTAKRKAISDVMNGLTTYFATMDDDKYFELINKIIEKNAKPHSGEICFNTYDFSRLPNNYLMTINQLLPLGGALSISKTPIDIKHGCLIKYDNIIIDCTFSSLIEQNKYDLEDSTNNMLNDFWG